MNRLARYFQNHARAFFSSLGRLLTTPFTTIITVLVLAITIAIAASFYLLVKNTAQLSAGLEASNQMSVFLKQSVSDQAARRLAQQLEQRSTIAEVKFISREAALTEFKLHSGFGDALNALDQNPLPAVIQVLPAARLGEEQALESLADDIQSMAQVDFVQLDMQWVKRLHSMLELAGRAVAILNTLLAFAVIFITGNTIRLELQNRREEVLIAKLVGATHAFIQRPFVYTGLWLGMAAGFVAWLVVTGVALSLQTPVTNISRLYNNQFNILGFSFTEALAIIAGTATLGAIGALMVLYHQLQQIKPQ